FVSSLSLPPHVRSLSPVTLPHLPGVCFPLVASSQATGGEAGGAAAAAHARAQCCCHARTGIGAATFCGAGAGAAQGAGTTSVRGAGAGSAQGENKGCACMRPVLLPRAHRQWSRHPSWCWCRVRPSSFLISPCAPSPPPPLPSQARSSVLDAVIHPIFSSSLFLLSTLTPHRQEASAAVHRVQRQRARHAACCHLSDLLLTPPPPCSLPLLHPGKKRRLLFIECSGSVHAMLDAAKFADLVLLLIETLETAVQRQRARHAACCHLSDLLLTPPSPPCSLPLLHPGKKRRLLFIECSGSVHAMLDAAKFADLVLLLIDGSFGFEMVGVPTCLYMCVCVCVCVCTCCVRLLCVRLLCVRLLCVRLLCVRLLCVRLLCVRLLCVRLLCVRLLCVSVHAMLDVAKFADLVLLLIDGSFGFEMVCVSLCPILQPKPAAQACLQPKPACSPAQACSPSLQPKAIAEDSETRTSSFSSLPPLLSSCPSQPPSFCPSPLQETFEFLNMLQVHGFPKVMGMLTHLDGFRDPRKLTFAPSHCHAPHSFSLSLRPLSPLFIFSPSQETFEFLNMLQVHGFPKVMGVLTHLDGFRDPRKLKKTKKTLKHRFWTEIYDGAKLFYLSGLIHG
ncbi:unnamed protein product, partial [Closterium sp. NIES-54]